VFRVLLVQVVKEIEMDKKSKRKQYIVGLIVVLMGLAIPISGAFFKVDVNTANAMFVLMLGLIFLGCLVFTAN
jgi:hypothetical protein